MFRAIVKMQTTPAQRVANGFAGNRDLETYLQHQYVPADKGRFSNTLEYSYDDWTVSQLAKALEKRNITEHSPTEATGGKTQSTRRQVMPKCATAMENGKRTLIRSNQELTIIM